MNTYESKRVIFNEITKKYKEYIELYKYVNNGSVDGLTSFDDFYWNYTYYSRYATNRVNESRGY